MTDQSTYLVMPSPISVNALYLNRKGGKGRGRIKTQEYQAWLREAAQVLSLQPELPAYAARVDISIFCGTDGAQGIDIDNASKAIVDALVSHGVLVSDKPARVRRVSPEWVHGFRRCIVLIKPSQPHIDRSDLIECLPRQARGLVV